ncbi:MAG: metallophosphoesterase [Chloroflexi bacterium]|nr:metallophosphoesterase [Chloroflexota bacterium]
MKILAVSDQVVERIYTLAANGHFRDVDMILGCGDLSYEYLEYLLTILNIPLYYVPGNHDPKYNSQLAESRAEGGTNLDQKVVRVNGMLLAGLGGSVRYQPGGVNQYTQTEMYLRMIRLLPGLLWNRLRYGRALDILVTHSPPFGIHDEDSQAHQGLKAFNCLIQWARPRYHFHGHTHFYQHNLAPSVTKVGITQVMNIYPYKEIEIQDA